MDQITRALLIQQSGSGTRVFNLHTCVKGKGGHFEHDGNKTKMLRPNPTARMQKRRKLFCCNTHVSYQKITWCKNVRSDDQYNVWHCFCTHCTKEHRCLLQFSIIMLHSVFSCTTLWKQDQKYKTKTKTKTKAARPRPRPRAVWDRSCHKTAVSNPNTVLSTNWTRSLECCCCLYQPTVVCTRYFC